MRNLNRLIAYIRPHLNWLIAGCGLMMAVGLLEGITVMLLRPVTQLVLEPGAASRDIYGYTP